MRLALAPLLLLAPMLHPLAPASPLHLQHGTLIAAVLCQDGLAIASDRRRMALDGTYSDSTTKAHSVGRNGVFVASGTTVLEHSSDRLDVHAVVHDYFAEATLVKAAGVRSCLREQLENDAREFFSRISSTDWLRSHTGTATDLFRVVVFASEPSGFSSTDIACRVSSHGAHPLPVCTVEVASPFTARLTMIGGEGTPQIMSSILSRTDPTWHDLETDPVLARVLFATHSIRASLSAKDAVYAGRRLIQLVSERKQGLGFEADVSPTADCLLLRLDGTVERIP